MPFAAGSFAFPTSTGMFSVSGLGFQPQLVVMFGGNQAGEDTLLTGLTRPGVFVSICARDYTLMVAPSYAHVDGEFTSYANLEATHPSYSAVLADTISAINSFCLSIAGNTAGGGTAVGLSRASLPVRMQGSAGATAIDYRASAITFDADGFTLTVSHAAPGNRPIHWWATDQAASVRADNLAGSFNGGFEIKGFLGLNSPAGAVGEGPETQTNGSSWLHFGTSHYPGTATTLEARWSGTTHTGCLPSSGIGRQGFTEQFQYEGIPANQLCFDLRTSGSALGDSYIQAVPSALHGNTAVISQAGGSQPDRTMVAWTSAEGIARALVTPATVGGITTISPPAHFNEFQLIMFTTINGPAGILADAQLRYGIGILHPDYQGCVVMGADGSFYQSRSKMAANCTAAGAQAAEGAIQGPTFTAKTVLGGAINGTYHAFGIPGLELPAWIPQIYRRIRSL